MFTSESESDRVSISNLRYSQLKFQDLSSLEYTYWGPNFVLVIFDLKNGDWLFCKIYNYTR